jgi:hypothetical protein
VIIILAVVMLLGMTLIPSNASAGTTWSRDVPGPVGGVSNITMTSNGHVRVQSSGTAHYSAYFITTFNFNKAENNTTFAYVQELSAMNVTSVDLQPDLPAGSYGVYYVLLEAGNISDNGYPGGVIITYPSSGGNPIPWDSLAIIGATALVSVLATYAIMRYGKTRS